MNLFWDNASTTPVDPNVIDATVEAMQKDYYNPSALYDKGVAVKRRVETARHTVAAALHVKPETVIFTSGATEANNWVFGSGFKNKKGNIVISAGEHPSVYEPTMALKSKGADVRVVALTHGGTIDVEAFKRAVDENTSLVSVMHCSNETGAVNPIAEVAKIVRTQAPRALLHSDGVQAFKKIDTDLPFMDVDMYSVSAHKIGGPKGIGALIAKGSLAPLLLGGGQERGLRSGTENTYGIIGFGEAVKQYRSDAPKYMTLLRACIEQIPDVVINGDPTVNSGYILSVSILGVKAEVLQHILSDCGVYVGTGSACSSKSRDNRILKSMGVDRAGIEGNIRISLGRDTTEQEVIEGTAVIRECVDDLRGKIHG